MREQYIYLPGVKQTLNRDPLFKSCLITPEKQRERKRKNNKQREKSVLLPAIIRERERKRNRDRQRERAIFHLPEKERPFIQALFQNQNPLEREIKRESNILFTKELQKKRNRETEREIETKERFRRTEREAIYSLTSGKQTLKRDPIFKSCLRTPEKEKQRQRRNTDGQRKSNIFTYQG